MFFAALEVLHVFVDFLRKVAEKYEFRAIYCFMPDHAHLILLGSSDTADLLRGVEQLKQATGYYLSKSHNGIRWQKSFYDRIIRQDELHSHVAYVLDNPVRWGLVTDWRTYPFIGAIGLDLEEFLKDFTGG